MNKTDKAKVRVAVKMYLSLRPKATAKEMATAINELNIGLYCDGVTASEIAKDIHYCIGKRNLLGNVSYTIEQEKNGKFKKYFLGGK